VKISGNFRLIHPFKDGDGFAVDLIDFHWEDHTMPMKYPPHPGRSIQDGCLDPLGLSVTDGAGLLGVARHTLSRVIHGHAGISPEMAIRLEKAGWSIADTWVRMQAAYVLAQARKNQDEIQVKPHAPVDA
jgi:addiction module HigA family antidote